MYSFNYEENLIGHSFLFYGSPPFFNKSWLCFFARIFVILCAFFCRKLQICFIHQTKKIVSPEKISIFIDNQLGRRSTAKIERGLGTESARLTKIESDLCIERARLGTFRGFGTERASLERSVPKPLLIFTVDLLPNWLSMKMRIFSGLTIFLV